MKLWPKTFKDKRAEGARAKGCNARRVQGWEGKIVQGGWPKGAMARGWKGERMQGQEGICGYFWRHVYGHFCRTCPWTLHGHPWALTQMCLRTLPRLSVDTSRTIHGHFYSSTSAAPRPSLPTSHLVILALPDI